MKELFHICIATQSEVLLRSIEDVRLFTNTIAILGTRYHINILTDAVMSTHLHINCFCDDPREYAYVTTISVTKQFNYQHQRHGNLFDKRPLIKRIYGPIHCQMAMNYGLRQAVHHGITESPFEYPFGTSNSLFLAQRGCTEKRPSFRGQEIKQFVPRNVIVPDHFEADENGIILRYSFEEIQMVENWYGTFKNFMYSLLRQTNEKWLGEQYLDKNDCPLITLNELEHGYSDEEIAQMLRNEGNAKFIRRGLSDMDVCQIIDRDLLGCYGVSSVYCLDYKQKMRLAEYLRKEIGINNPKQIERCLAMKYSPR